MGFGEKGLDRKLLGRERRREGEREGNIELVKKCNTNVIICCLH